jgi:hypothetical protein
MPRLKQRTIKKYKSTPEEDQAYFQRRKENRDNRWRPIRVRRPSYSSAEKKKWWWDPEHE